MTSVALRPATPDDDPFLRAVYGSTRVEELAVTPWTEEQKAAFITMQYDAQMSYYREVYDGASFDVIVVDGEDAGRLYTARLPGELRVVDIALLPEYRGRGVGARLLGEIFEEAAATACKVVIHVEHENPARSLYDRLGFVLVEDLGIYQRMEWSPPA